MILRRTERGIFGKLPMELMLEVLGHLQVPTERGFFGKLPMEMMLAIFEHLEYGSAIFLAATNHYFRSLVDPIAVVSEERKAKFVYYSEVFKRREFGYACFGCYRLRPEQCFMPFFTPKQLKSNASDREWLPWQFCADCAKVNPITIPHSPTRVANSSKFLESIDDGSAASSGAEASATGEESDFAVWDCDSCYKEENINMYAGGYYVWIHHGGCPKSTALTTALRANVVPFLSEI
ncbi:hypothetical protein BC567DRAFT_294853 [Phyllosticta citribraziliensis]